MPRARKHADPDQPMLSTDDDTFEGDTAWDIGHRHGLEGHEYFHDRLPAENRQDYARGYTRGAAERSNRD